MISRLITIHVCGRCENIFPRFLSLLIFYRIILCKMFVFCKDKGKENVKIKTTLRDVNSFFSTLKY